jgi:hypothetical protein
MVSVDRCLVDPHLDAIRRQINQQADPAWRDQFGDESCSKDEGLMVQLSVSLCEYLDQLRP